MTALDTYAHFLTERWDEAERVARDMDDQAVRGRPFFDLDALAGGTGIRALIDTQCIRDDLASKRAILDTLVEYDRMGNLSPEAWQILDAVAGGLAAPFRDHPDHPANQEA